MPSITTTELVLQSAKNIDSAVNDLMLASKNMGPFERAMSKAKIISLVDVALSKDGAMKDIMLMQGKPYGFRTDSKNPQGYNEEVVKACLIESTISGVEPTGNQFNILGGNCYITKNGCKNILMRMGVAYRCVTGHSKKLDTGMHVVPTKVIWKDPNTNTERTQELELSVTVFEGITKEEAKKGQAERDGMAWLIEELTGMPMNTGDEGQQESVSFTKKAEAQQTVDAEVIPHEDVVVSATENEQSKFDKYISKATSIEDLESRVTVCLTNGSFPNKEYFDLTVYNKTIESLK